MIVKRGNKFVLLTKDGRRKLGEFRSREAAVRRERQIQIFKRRGKKK